jgi:hypothetical protein
MTKRLLFPAIVGVLARVLSPLPQVFRRDPTLDDCLSRTAFYPLVCVIACFVFMWAFDIAKFAASRAGWDKLPVDAAGFRCRSESTTEKRLS